MSVFSMTGASSDYRSFHRQAPYGPDATATTARAIRLAGLEKFAKFSNALDPLFPVLQSFPPEQPLIEGLLAELDQTVVRVGQRAYAGVPAYFKLFHRLASALGNFPKNSQEGHVWNGAVFHHLEEQRERP